MEPEQSVTNNFQERNMNPSLRYQLIILLTAAIFTTLFAASNKDLFTARNIQKAYEKQTRDYSGKPGKNYWQNRADYKIDVQVYPHKDFLKGKEEIIYFNQSPDTLKSLVVRLLPDLFKTGNKRDFDLNVFDLHEGVSIHSLVINGTVYDLDLEKSKSYRSGTNLFVKLKEQLLPDSKLEIFIEWSTYIASEGPVRAGIVDPTTGFIAYWYPQIAVYDDLYGWDKSSYTGTHEFYGDFNSYDVNIKLPKGYTVWATGMLQNVEELLPKEQLKRFRKAAKSDKVVQIMNKTDYDSLKVVMNPDGNKWHFKAQKVTDFTFAYSDHYLWDATHLKAGIDGGDVMVHAAYNRNSKDFYDVAEIAKNTIDYLAHNFPRQPYPFPKMTVFNGFGGMEFPMIINDASRTTLRGTTGLTSHEISHMYFPFYMGVNEHLYSWMDEGFAVMLPYDYQESIDPSFDVRARGVRNYEKRAGTHLDMPCMIPSIQLRGSTFRTHAYARSGIAYEALRRMIGKEKFIEIMTEYINRWHEKHPTPYDFFNTFSDVYGSDLSWFFKPWFYEFGYPDIALRGMVTQGSKNIITVEKVGIYPTDVELTVIYEDKSSEVLKETALIWKDGNKTFQFKINATKKITKIELGSELIPDSDRTNNILEF